MALKRHSSMVRKELVILFALARPIKELSARHLNGKSVFGARLRKDNDSLQFIFYEC